MEALRYDRGAAPRVAAPRTRSGLDSVRCRGCLGTRRGRNDAKLLIVFPPGENRSIIQPMTVGWTWERTAMRWRVRAAAEVGRLRSVAIALVLTIAPAPAWPAHGQELEPRFYVNTPVGLNFLIAGYGYTDGDVVFSLSSPLKEAEVQTHAGFLSYVRSLDVAGLSGKFGVVLPYAGASGSATLAGQPREREVSGFADPRVRLSLNLYGAPALSLEEFRRWQQDLIVGVALEVSAPLGQYDSDKLLNIGTNRWSIRPELGVSKALDRVTLEMSAAARFFTPNDDFLGGQTLEREPLYSVQGHLVYELRPGLWAALDATYYTGGRAGVDGVKGERQENVRLGLTIVLPVDRYNSIKLYGSTGVYSRSGTDFDALGIASQVRWGAGL
jgi:hypothetical protein